jgi:ATP-binding protein involved in chromosome partitioning
LAFFLQELWLKKRKKVEMINREDISSALGKIKYPGYDQDIVTFGVVKNVEVSGDAVTITLDLRAKDPQMVNMLSETVRMQIAGIPGVNTVQIKSAGSAQPAAGPAPDEFLPQVKYKVAVASGKGGVGKSTVAVNLAVALAKSGARVGLLDSDIYGPSIPLMLGITGKPDFDGEKLIPVKKYGVDLMSLGFLVEEDNPVIWRGPLVMRALQQLMRDVRWGDLDIMLFDMPPGTGDAQLTLSQSVTLDGAVIVSTPQDVALLDAVKGVKMFEKVNVPILGIVENMSYFICNECGARTDIFSAGGVRRECERLGVDLLGEIPLDVEIRLGGDEGIPIVEKNTENPQSKAFMEIAGKLITRFKIG